jgi:hypothetical protein
MPNVYDVEHDGKVYEVEANSPEEAAATFDDKPQPSAADLNAMTAQNAQAQQGRSDELDYTPQEMDSKARGAVNAGYGVAEGGRKLLAGAQQLGANIQDAYNLFVHGKPINSEEAVRDPTGKLVQRVNEPLDSTKSKQQVAGELIRSQVQAESDKEAGVNIQARDAAAGATQLGALLAGPELALPKATTLTGGMLRTTAAGEMGAAGQFQADNDHGRDAVVAAVGGPLIGAVTGLVPAVKNVVGRALSRVAFGTRTGNAVASAEKVLPNVQLTLAQRTGVPELKTLERAVYDSKMVNHYANQTDAFVADAVNALKQPMREGQTMASDFELARSKADSALKGLKLNASNAYESGITEARRLAASVTKGGTLAPVPTPEFAKQASSIIDEERRVAARGLGSTLPEPYLKTLEKTAQAGATTPSELADYLKELTRLQKDTGNPVGQALASRMRGALDGDLDKLDAMRNQPGMPRLDDSVTRILDTRAEYRRAMQAAEALSTSASYKLLGLGNVEATADDALTHLKAMNPGQRDSVRKFMEANSPELLTSLKDAVVKDAAKRAGTIRAAADSQQDLDQMLDAMFDAKNGYDMRTSGLWNADELKKIEGIKNGMRAIANNRPGVGGSGTPVKPEDIAINLVSRHSAFLARQLTRIMTGTQGSRFFTDPKVFERLSTINRSTTGSASNLIGRAALLDLINSDYPAPQEDDK